MRKVSLFGIAMIVIAAGIAAWASSGHSAVKPPTGLAEIDPLSLMANAKNLQESLNRKMWPDNAIVRY